MTIHSCFPSTHCSTDFSILQKLNSCNSIKQLKQIHSLTIKLKKTHKNLHIKMLSLSLSFPHFTDLTYIHTLFSQTPNNKDLSFYNDYIKSLSRISSNESSMLSLFLYKRLVENGLFGDNYTYPFVLKACCKLAGREGEMVHATVVKNGFVLNLYVVNTLMRFYGVCGRVDDARKVFDESPVRDLVTWTVLVQGYVDNGFCYEGVEVFFDMCGKGVEADGKLMAVVVSAVATLGDLGLGRRLHEYVANRGVSFDVFVENSLLDMYLKCGDTGSASVVFNSMRVKNVVSWNSMISGLSQSGQYKEALNVFHEMRVQRVDPDEVTLVAVVNSCANLGVLELGKWVHAYVDKCQMDIDGYIGNSLIDMYAKCGCMDDAMNVFKSIKSKDVYAYSTVIMGLAMHGKGELALKLFDEMGKMGIRANEVTFVGVLTACCHAGFVDEGKKRFSDMSRLYNIQPQKEHYGCMVDLLGRAGQISEAFEFVMNMPNEPDKLIWGSLLGACRIHGRLELAETVMKRLVELEPNEDGSYVLMSNIYASENDWKNVTRLRKGMKRDKIVKLPGCSSIELDGMVYEFRKGDKSHSKTKEVCMLLDTSSRHLYDSGLMINDYESFTNNGEP